MLNLSLKTLTDAAVERLFSSLPFHCVIMLEDIDATKPLQRDTETKQDAAPAPPLHGVEIKSEAGDSDDGCPVVLSGPGRPRGLRAKEFGVTLSGLLNAIDGIGASEGTTKEARVHRIHANEHVQAAF